MRDMNIKFKLNDDVAVRKAANSARTWYALLIALSIFGGMFIDSGFTASGDAAVILTNIQTGEGMYRLGIASFLAGQVCQVLTMLALFRLFQSVDKDQARALFAYVIIMVPIAFAAVLGKFAPLIILNNPDLFHTFEPVQLQAISLLFIELQNHGIILLEIFWGLWLLPLGILVLKSGYFPKSLGIALLIGCLGHVMSSFVVFLPSGSGAVMSNMGTVLSFGELPFFLWLMIFGARNLVFSGNPVKQN